ncbi:MAG: hypothetical protein AABW72_01820 [archaeon]
MLENKKRVIFFFGIIYAIFIAIFLLLLFFNSGLKLDREVTSAGEKLFISNTTSHLIKNIDILDEKGNKIGFIEELKPLEKKEIDMPKNIAKITASAPWHVPVSTAIIKMEAGIPLNLSANYPKMVKSGMNFKIYLEICSDEMEEGEIEINIDEKLLEADDSNIDNDGSLDRLITKEEGKCVTEEFEFTAIGKGTAQIIFKVKVLDTIKELKIETVIE